MKKKTIKVTWNDIEYGNKNRRASPRGKHCPVASATRRAFKKGKAYVNIGYTDMLLGIKERQIPLPVEASRFISQWERYDGVGPFQFTLEY